MLHASAGRTDAAADALANAARLAAANEGGDAATDAAQDATTGRGDSPAGPDAPLVPVAVAKNDDELVHSEVGYLLALGKVRSDQGRPAAAGKVFELALKLKPLAAAGWVALGGIRAKQGEAEKALAAFETALQCDPRSADAHYGLGSCLLGCA
jgi:tetratricopeptide (TPR) repeat protein